MDPLCRPYRCHFAGPFDGCAQSAFQYPSYMPQAPQVPSQSYTPDHVYPSPTDSIANSPAHFLGPWPLFVVLRVSPSAVPPGPSHSARGSGLGQGRCKVCVTCVWTMRESTWVKVGDNCGPTIACIVWSRRPTTGSVSSQMGPRPGQIARSEGRTAHRRCGRRRSPVPASQNWMGLRPRQHRRCDAGWAVAGRDRDWRVGSTPDRPKTYGVLHALSWRRPNPL